MRNLIFIAVALLLSTPVLAASPESLDVTSNIQYNIKQKSAYKNVLELNVGAVSPKDVFVISVMEQVKNVASDTVNVSYEVGVPGIQAGSLPPKSAVVSVGAGQYAVLQQSFTCTVNATNKAKVSLLLKVTGSDADSGKNLISATQGYITVTVVKPN